MYAFFHRIQFVEKFSQITVASAAAYQFFSSLESSCNFEEFYSVTSSYWRRHWFSFSQRGGGKTIIVLCRRGGGGGVDLKFCFGIPSFFFVGGPFGFAFVSAETPFSSFFFFASSSLYFRQTFTLVKDYPRMIGNFSNSSRSYVTVYYKAFCDIYILVYTYN